MTRDTAALPICPRCHGQDVAVVLVERWDRGTRIVVKCDACGCGSQAWIPRPEPADPGAWIL